MKDVVIVNQDKLDSFKKAVSGKGANSLHILSDFDRTLTKGTVNGEKISSIISILRDGKHLTPDYSAKAHGLFDKYHPMEIDPNLSLEEKKKAMKEWWTKHFNLLIESGLNKKDLREIVQSNKFQLRDGFDKFAHLLERWNIPLVIMSSAGVGDAIEMFLKRENKFSENIHVIANTFEWNQKGRAIKAKEPIIHVANKDETAIQGFPVFNKIRGRKNVLLLGDSLGDVGMVEGFEYANLLKIGFWNGEEKDIPEKYKESYDVLLTNDTSLDFVTQLLKEII